MKKFIAGQFLFAFVLASAAYAQPRVAETRASSDRPGRTRIEKRREVSSGLFVRTELFFGRSRPNGKEIDESEFAAFLAETVTPEFSEGLTVLDAFGQFRDPSGEIVRERAKVLVLLYPQVTRRQSDAKIERIRKVYKTRFDQHSVLRSDTPQPVRVFF